MSSLFNALLLLLWLRIVPVSRQEAVGNPLVSVPLNQADHLADLIRPVFGSRATRPFSALVLLVLLLALRGAAVAAAGIPWTLAIGPAVFLPNPGAPAECILFSFLSFAWMVERLWILVLFFGWLRRRRNPSMEDGLAQSLARPVSEAPRWMQLLLAALLAVVLSHATIAAGFACSPVALLSSLPEGLPPAWQEVFRLGTKILPDFRATTPLALALMLVGVFAEVFSTSVDAVVAFILAAIVGMFMRWTYWLALGNAGLSYIVGSFFQSTMKWGGMSFAPLLYLLVAGILYFVVYNVGTGLVLAFSGVFTPEVLEAVKKAMEAAAAP